MCFRISATFEDLINTAYKQIIFLKTQRPTLGDKYLKLLHDNTRHLSLIIQRTSFNKCQHIFIKRTLFTLNKIKNKILYELANFSE